ncbi:hypothetical protein BpHYR1_031544 [Brachionus plicatilis]|uniref:Uncharacterized protein n=1 Tax=Brachionus plicatilis TaxID=10195 RepID=A0A3M7PXC5_BRAPC|nr:hypothetical protein BpHYR1_031544 [Brachionus plicatilis]
MTTLEKNLNNLEEFTKLFVKFPFTIINIKKITIKTRPINKYFEFNVEVFLIQMRRTFSVKKFNLRINSHKNFIRIQN